MLFKLLKIGVMLVKQLHKDAVFDPALVGVRGRIAGYGIMFLLFGVILEVLQILLVNLNGLGSFDAGVGGLQEKAESEYKEEVPEEVPCPATITRGTKNIPNSSTDEAEKVVSLVN